MLRCPIWLGSQGAPCVAERTDHHIYVHADREAGVDGGCERFDHVQLHNRDHVLTEATPEGTLNLHLRCAREFADHCILEYQRRLGNLHLRRANRPRRSAIAKVLINTIVQ